MASTRNKKTVLARSIEQSSIPIYIVGSDHRISFCNASLCDWVGASEEQLLGGECIYHGVGGLTHAASDPDLAGLCPPPTAFEGTDCPGFVTQRQRGRLQHRETAFYALNEMPPSAVLAVVHGLPRDESRSRTTNQLSPADLHLAIQQIQVESMSQINLELLVGTSHHSRKIRQQIDVAATTGASVAVIGPTGCGRRMIARLIHQGQGDQPVGPLIPIEGIMSDAETVQATVKDLYRHYKSHSAEPLGRLLVADLDRMPIDAQTELLGFSKLPDFQLPITVTATELPVTERTLPGSTERHVIPELWSLVSAIVISVPSLSSRPEDVPFLAQAILEQLNSKNTKQLSGFQDAALKLLCQYSWPGELAELTSTLQAAFRAAESSLVAVDDLPRHIDLSVKAARAPRRSIETIDLDQFLSDIESELIHRAIAVAKGNKTQAAKLLRISRARLIRKSDAGESAKETDLNSP